MHECHEVALFKIRYGTVVRAGAGPKHDVESVVLQHLFRECIAPARGPHEDINQMIAMAIDQGRDGTLVKIIQPTTS